MTFADGMNASEDAAQKWTSEEREDVMAAISFLASLKEPFTADDIWIFTSAPVTKGLASCLNVAARRGVIRNTGRLLITKRGGPHDHGQRLSIWEGC